MSATTALLVTNSILVIGLIAGVLTNGVLYGQTTGQVTNLNATFAAVNITTFAIINNSDLPARFPLEENIPSGQNIFIGYQANITPLGVDVSFGGACSYQNITMGYVKFIVTDIFPATNPYPVSEQLTPFASIVEILNTNNGDTFPGLATLYVQSNGLDILVDVRLPPNAPPNTNNIISIVPFTVFRYPL